ncbi:polysaccharide biosynthesis protein [Caloramator proteoclasticus]|uniref:NDP-sugar epimerase, includes UDP-GlcNAc-inverting 4,6-dehydratase FlaA1 and capsular polysaccharide biosynthesis protein EpsC n=1 Tax=Caloramator proteoclasticus DSM 10124 TaxID=1121262 RepID=A0A1M4WMC7_9CLOT|nr:nucleoside-diphosphate sugar epimerase/dehydratase [Caloramator proteoclasticus]SHE82122.1 NDP-sugar epimerase, includes UDP-GlcNAc-inverting 4,6-dehydratase FlaA1 and capsular polysaccharide biosynthesis protein EpsC [Caloramator proteoclasticus DSM 10124]
MEKLKKYRYLTLILSDIILLNISLVLASFFVYGDRIKYSFNNSYLLLNTVFLVASYALFGLYKSLWHYASVDELISSFFANTLFLLTNLLLNNFLFNQFETRFVLLYAIFTALLTNLLRLSFRVYRRVSIGATKKLAQGKKRALIVGAGSGGTLLLKEIRQNILLNYEVVGFIDDDPAKIGKTIMSTRVLGNRDDIPSIADRYKADIIIIAIPTLNIHDKREIIKICKSTGCEVKIMPSMDEVLSNTERVREIRDVKIEDLLKRDPIKLDNRAIKEYIEDKVVLVTGGGGSIGSELCRQVIRFNPKKLLILDIYENNAYDLELELRANHPHIDIEVLIASIRDKKRMETIFEKYRPYVVFHAAAHKHVPLMEHNPSEAVKNNVFGTLNLVECADKYSVKRFVLISTDKAVNPTNVMGATKRTAEMIVQAFAKKSKTEFVAVRFGNVLGSNGSVIPLFKRQIEKGGPVTVTHREITRYFMTIPEACQLVLQSAAFAKGGEIFVLDMGEPVKIYDMACNLIRLSGFEPEKDIKIQITGLRPGEKLYEELLLSEEGLTKTQNSKIYVAKPLNIDYEELKLKLDALKFALQSEEPMKVKKQLKEIVETYKVYDEVAAGEE